MVELAVVWPAGTEFDEHAALLDLERPNLEAELGCGVRVVREDPGSGPRWICRVDPAHRAAPLIRSRGELVESVGSTHAELWETFSLRHTWLRHRRQGHCAEVRAEPAEDLPSTVERIVDEVGFSYPAFSLRGLDWRRICAEYGPGVLAAEDPLAVCQEWLAQLQDAHTAVHAVPRGLPLPYVASVSGETVTLLRVPEGSAAWLGGVRPGWRLGKPEVEDLARRTSGSAHMHPYMVGRRLLSGTAERPVDLVAVGPRAQRAEWSEVPTGLPHGPLVSWCRLGSGVGYLRVQVWLVGLGIPDAVDVALTELAGCPALVLDLRGNVGGNYLLALATRDRFVHAETTMGAVRYAVGDGLSDPVSITARPADRVRWAGKLLVLTDALTYSASEDFLLGLQGLDHVRVVGEPSGGGSGRVRAVRLLPGWSMTISTALTYDRGGRCVENAGIPVDRPVPALRLTDGDPVLAAAETLAVR